MKFTDVIYDSFSTAEAARLSGLTLRQLDHWARQDFFCSSVQEASGYGSCRRYSFPDIVQASGRRAPARLGRRARPDAALRRGLEASGRRRARGSRPGAASRYREPGALGAFRLGSRGSAPGGVVIEISEKEVVGDYSSFRDILDTLRGARLKIAIDDAGSGYSGLETILYLRPDYIKVADSLVRNLETDPIKREIIASLASIGRRIQATLIAEGIEREEERRTLLALEIEYGQGFLLGRPSFQVLPRRKNGSLPPSPGGRGTG